MAGGGRIESGRLEWVGQERVMGEMGTTVTEQQQQNFLSFIYKNKRREDIVLGL